MAGCCDKKSDDMDVLARRQTRVLWIVLFINLLMFGVEFSAGLLSQSLALLGDSMDMLGDALAYGSSIYVVSRGTKAKENAAIFKAGLMAATGLFLAGRTVYQFAYGGMPSGLTMGLIGSLALVANVVCLYLLTRHKNDDINFRSVWLCSRNDLIANSSVLLAAGLVVLTGSRWPDLIVGLGITLLFLKSAWSVLQDVARSRSLAVG